MFWKHINVYLVINVIQKNLDKESKKKFKNIFKFSNNDIKRFLLLLREGFYPYEYMDDWEKFNETTLPGKNNNNFIIT